LVPQLDAERVGPRLCRQARACVDTAHRKAWLQHHGRITYGPVPISLGRRGHRTPQGHFRVAWKDEVHTSSIHGTPMPYAVFFATGGIAFHQGSLHAPSYGCVHLSRTAAKRFFRALDVGDRVVVR
jgi:lipoprotein-anchoring transpeptidase ErfK/SrfK